MRVTWVLDICADEAGGGRGTQAERTTVRGGLSICDGERHRMTNDKNEVWDLALLWTCSLCDLSRFHIRELRL
jgi:hypothetical protein